MFDIGSVSFSGKHYRVPNAELTPRPVQERLPILVGGNNTGLLRAVARCADQWNANGPLETVLKRTKVLKQQCEKVGRDMATIHRTANVLVNIDDHVIGGGREARPGWINAHRMYDLVDALTPYAEAGVDEIIVYFNPNLSLPRRKELLTEFMGQVAPAFA